MVPGVPAFPPVHLAHGEVVKREWLVSRMKRAGWIDSSLVVTDARVIYRARSKSFLGFSSSTREVQVQDVRGAALETRRGLTPVTLFSVALGFVLALIVINLLNGFFVMMSAFGSGSFTGGSSGQISPWTVLLYMLLFLITITVVIVKYFSKEIVLVIFSRDSDTSPISLTGSQWRNAGGILAAVTVAVFSPLLLLAEWLGFADATSATNQADPAATQVMYNEFGALILDLQNRGVLGGTE